MLSRERNVPAFGNRIRPKSICKRTVRNGELCCFYVSMPLEIITWQQQSSESYFVLAFHFHCGEMESTTSLRTRTRSDFRNADRSSPKNCPHFSEIVYVISLSSLLYNHSHLLFPLSFVHPSSLDRNLPGKKTSSEIPGLSLPTA